MKLADITKIRTAILSRMEELNLKPADVIREAGSRNMKITPSNFSKYKAGKPGSMTDTQVLWVCCYLAIPISLNVGSLVVTGSAKWEIPKYNKELSEKLLKNAFGG